MHLQRFGLHSKLKVRTPTNRKCSNKCNSIVTCEIDARTKVSYSMRPFAQASQFCFSGLDRRSEDTVRSRFTISIFS